MLYREVILTKEKFLGFVKICSNWLGMEKCHLLISEVIQEELSKSIEYVWHAGPLCRGKTHSPPARKLFKDHAEVLKYSESKSWS